MKQLVTLLISFSLIGCAGTTIKEPYIPTQQDYIYVAGKILNYFTCRNTKQLTAKQDLDVRYLIQNEIKARNIQFNQLKSIHDDPKKSGYYEATAHDCAVFAEEAQRFIANLDYHNKMAMELFKAKIMAPQPTVIQNNVGDTRPWYAKPGAFQ